MILLRKILYILSLTFIFSSCTNDNLNTEINGSQEIDLTTNSIESENYVTYISEIDRHVIQTEDNVNKVYSSTEDTYLGAYIFEVEDIHHFNVEESFVDIETPNGTFRLANINYNEDEHTYTYDFIYNDIIFNNIVTTVPVTNGDGWFDAIKRIGKAVKSVIKDTIGELAEDFVQGAGCSHAATECRKAGGLPTTVFQPGGGCYVICNNK